LTPEQREIVITRYKEGELAYFRKEANYWTKPEVAVTLKLAGSENLMNQFLGYIRTIVPDFTGSVRPYSSIFKVAIGGNTAKAVIRSLYSDPCPVLDRKAETARQILEE